MKTGSIGDCTCLNKRDKDIILASLEVRVLNLEGTLEEAGGQEKFVLGAIASLEAVKERVAAVPKCKR